MMSSTLSQLVDQIEKLNYVVKEVISYNEECFIDPLMIQVDTYKIRRQRCYKLMTAKGDKRILDKLQIKLENVSKQIVTWTHSEKDSWRQWGKDHKSKREHDATVMECLKQIQISIEKVSLNYPKEEWIDK